MASHALDVVAPSFTHVKRFLFDNRRLALWWRVALVAALADGAGGGSMNFRGTSHSSRGFFASASTPSRVWGSISDSVARGTHWAEAHWALLIFAITGILLLLFLLNLVFLFIQCRMRFIFIDSALELRLDSIRAGWRRRQDEARRYFRWKFGYMLCGMAISLLLIGAPLYALWHNGWLYDLRSHGTQMLAIGLGWVAAFVLFALSYALIGMLTCDLIAPQLAFEPISVSQGWGRLWSMMQQRPGDFALFVVLKILLGIALLIATFLACLVALIALLIPVLILVLITILVAKSMAIGWSAATILAAVLFAAIVLAVVICLFLLAYAPMRVFELVYGLRFLAAQYEPLREQIQRIDAPPPPPWSETPPPAPLSPA